MNVTGDSSTQSHPMAASTSTEVPHPDWAGLRLNSQAGKLSSKKNQDYKRKIPNKSSFPEIPEDWSVPGPLLPQLGTACGKAVVRGNSSSTSVLEATSRIHTGCCQGTHSIMVVTVLSMTPAARQIISYSLH